jgi:hypothetical protein
MAHTIQYHITIKITSQVALSLFIELISKLFNKLLLSKMLNIVQIQYINCDFNVHIAKTVIAVT